MDYIEIISTNKVIDQVIDAINERINQEDLTDEEITFLNFIKNQLNNVIIKNGEASDEGESNDN